MSLPNNVQNQQKAGRDSLEVEAEFSEEFKDEPPDFSFFNETSLDEDAFATSSLQLAASAILAVQQQQVPFELATSYFETGNVGNTSSSNDTRNGSHSSLSRSSSVGRPSQPGATAAVAGDRGASHPERHMWTAEETDALVDGCNKYGIGNWKAIINDEVFAAGFNGRTPGDLKDRFRTYFPDAYHELYPNAKTHTSRAVRSKAPDGKSIFEKGKTKERRPFTPAEDEVLKKGYQQHGSHWAKIAKDAVFEGRRKSTDLRDRFRNAFPSLYEQAGYKPRTKLPKKERRQSSSGSFSCHDMMNATTAEWPSDVMQRPDLQARSDTSTSVYSEVVSEHSEHSDEGESSDAVERSHFKDLSEDSLKSKVNPSGLKTTHTMTVPSNGSSSGSSAHNPSIHPPQKSSQHLLKRSNSTKKAVGKIGASLDHLVKSAYSKSSKEASIVNHQQAHLQHILNHQQQVHQQMQRDTMQENIASSLSQQRPPFNQSMSAGWVPRPAWITGSTTNDSTLVNMELDQMDELMNNHSASELLNSDGDRNIAAAATTMPAQSIDPTEEMDAMSIDQGTLVGTNQTDFASIYQHLAMATDTLPTNRALSMQSFQNLLDPLSDTGTSNSVWDQPSNTLPWTPISSAAAALNSSTSTHNTSNATRREHEHNQWAGDLLPRGTYPTNQEQLQQQQSQGPHGFVSMASMHLGHGNQGLVSSRSADENLGQEQRGSSNNNDFAFARHERADEHVPPSSGVDRHFQRNTDQLYSTPSVHELISHSTRRQSYPLRPFGWGEDGNGEEMMQAGYSNPYPYPADDIALLNSSIGGSLTLFPSLVTNNQANEYGHASMMRRRRSTDTLREGAFNFPQSWRGNLMDTNRLVGEEEEEEADGGKIVKEDDGEHRSKSTATSIHGTSNHSQSVSEARSHEAVDGAEDGDNDDERNAPSRAASVGNMDQMVGTGRDNILYAESLPDLSSALDGHISSAASESAFSHHHNMQMSYDDLDLPSFLNRSPSFLNATTPALTNFNASASDESSALKVTSAKAWSTSISGAGADRGAKVMANESADALEVVKNVPKNVNSFQSSSNITNSTASSLFSFASNPMNDAGALDRLEHLYLEGLHTPSSPLYSGQAFMTAAAGYGAQGGNAAGANNNGSTSSTGQKVSSAAAATPWWNNNERSAGGVGDASGYESV
ncbi:hypothetical protein CBS101457_002323 [Exobasidium rhododendri]|nr:hypothetical protein CBS101457_002323 [Exobasidium rhododendri]